MGSPYPPPPPPPFLAADSEKVAWAGWLGMLVAEQFYEYKAGERTEYIHVSTTFLSLDHNFSGVGPPIVYETMIFGPVLTEYQERYCTWAEAERGHAEMCRRVSSYLLQEGYSFIIYADAPQEYCKRREAGLRENIEKLHQYHKEMIEERGLNEEDESLNRTDNPEEKKDADPSE
jgi:hypothetical protein